jgi:von Willebrand factor A domain-containing protein 8
MEERRRYGAASSKTLPWLQTPLDEDHLVTVDNNGRIKLWEINAAALAQSLNIWRTAIGDEGDVQLTVKRPVSGDLSGPKVGKVDPKNTPHVGGNQWAGGTGGRDTAGLGGRGGPYRLDAGHTVHQVMGKSNIFETLVTF